LIADGRFQIAERAARSLAEDFQMPGIASVDALEVSRARAAGWASSFYHAQQMVFRQTMLPNVSELLIENELVVC
jgi:hypothetical protein